MPRFRAAPSPASYSRFQQPPDTPDRDLRGVTATVHLGDIEPMPGVILQDASARLIGADESGGIRWEVLAVILDGHQVRTGYYATALQNAVADTVASRITRDKAIAALEQAAAEEDA